MQNNQQQENGTCLQHPQRFSTPIDAQEVPSYFCIVQIQLPALLAKALYDNRASYDTELDFRKDAILTVIDQNPAGLEGWWLCTYKGRSGIAPGNRLQVIGVLEAPDKPGVALPKRSSGAALSAGKSPAVSAVSLHSIGQHSNLAWELYDNAGGASASGDQNHGDDAADGTSLSDSGSSNSQLRVNGLIMPNLSRQSKSVRFDDENARKLQQQHQQQQKQQQLQLQPQQSISETHTRLQPPARCPPTPDSFYDDLKNLDYSVVPRDVDASTTAVAAPNYDELPRRSEILAVRASAVTLQKDGDYALPPPPQSLQQFQRTSSGPGDYDYSLFEGTSAGPEYQNVGPVVAAAAAAAEVNLQQPDSQLEQSQQPQQHRITREFLDDLLLLSPTGSNRDSDGAGFGISIRSGSDHPDADKRSMISNTESIDSEDIGFRPECQLRLGRNEAVQRLRQMEIDFTEHCSRLYKFIHNRWKAEASLALNIDGIHPTLRELNELLGQLILFYYGVLNNARLESCPDRALCKKVWKHLRVFERNAAEFTDAVGGLERLNWNPKLVASACADPATDYLGFCVSSARDLQIQQRALSTAVHANSPLLFPTEPQLESHQPQTLQKSFAPPQQSQLEKIIPIETEERRRQSQPPLGTRSHNQYLGQVLHQSDGSYMRMSLLTDSAGLSQGDQELLAVFRERLRASSEVYETMSHDLLASLESRQASGAVIGALSRNLASRAYKLTQMTSMLHEGLHSVQLRASLEQLMGQMGPLLKAILRMSKATMETAPAEWQQQLTGQLARHIADSQAVVRELNQLVAPRIGL